MISAQSTGAPARKTKYRSFLSSNIEQGLKRWSYQCDSLPPLHFNLLFLWTLKSSWLPPSHSLFNHSFVSITFLWKPGILVACWPPACWHIFLRGSGGQMIWPFLRLCSKEGKELKWQYREKKTPKHPHWLFSLPASWPTSRTMQVLCIAFCCQALSLVSVSVLLARTLLKFLSGAGCCRGWSSFVLCSSHGLSLCLGVNKQRGSIFLQTLKSRSPDNYLADLPVTYL